MGSVYRPRPFDRFHRAGRQRTHCVRPPRHRPRHSPGRDNTDRPVTTRLPGCGNRQAVVARRGSGLSQRSPTPTTRPLLAGLGGPDRGPPFVGRVMLPQGVRWRREFAIGPPSMFLRRKPAIEPCLPRPAKEPPSGPDWIHEMYGRSAVRVSRRAGPGRGSVRSFTTLRSRMTSTEENDELELCVESARERCATGTPSFRRINDLHHV
jgi:hypothetical protein